MTAQIPVWNCLTATRLEESSPEHETRGQRWGGLQEMLELKVVSEYWGLPTVRFTLYFTLYGQPRLILMSEPMGRIMSPRELHSSPSPPKEASVSFVRCRGPQSAGSGGECQGPEPEASESERRMCAYASRLYIFRSFLRSTARPMVHIVGQDWKCIDDGHSSDTDQCQRPVQFL